MLATIIFHVGTGPPKYVHTPTASSLAKESLPASHPVVPAYAVPVLGKFVYVILSVRHTTPLFELSEFRLQAEVTSTVVEHSAGSVFATPEAPTGHNTVHLSSVYVIHVAVLPPKAGEQRRARESTFILIGMLQCTCARSSRQRERERDARAASVMYLYNVAPGTCASCDAERSLRVEEAKEVALVGISAHPSSQRPSDRARPMCEPSQKLAAAKPFAKEDDLKIRRAGIGEEDTWWREAERGEK